MKIYLFKFFSYFTTRKKILIEINYMQGSVLGITEDRYKNGSEADPSNKELIV